VWGVKHLLRVEAAASLGRSRPRRSETFGVGGTSQVVDSVHEREFARLEVSVRDWRSFGVIDSAH
jgi:hypothetical protein